MEEGAANACPLPSFTLNELMRLLLLLFFPLITIGQKNCEGFIVDKITGNRIPYATVGLIKENKGVSADEQGVFSINSSFPKIDSLRISSVGYKTQVLPVSEWANGSVIALEQEPGLLGEVVVSANRQKQIYTLNSFRHCSSNWYQLGPETFYQIAQRFEAPQPGMQLTDLELCKDQSASIFRLRMYDVDSVNQGPSRDLADTVIEIRSREKHIRVDLEKYNIIIPGKGFFVAVEWLFIPFNEEQEKFKVRGRKSVHILYKPFIRYVTNRNTPKGNVWLQHFNGKWAEIYASCQNQNFQITIKLR